MSATVIDGPHAGREFRGCEPPFRVMAPVLVSMDDEHWLPANHYRYPYSDKRYREHYFDCHNRLCWDFAHFMHTAEYRWTGAGNLAFVAQHPPRLASQHLTNNATSRNAN